MITSTNKITLKSIAQQLQQLHRPFSCSLARSSFPQCPHPSLLSRTCMYGHVPKRHLQLTRIGACLVRCLASLQFRQSNDRQSRPKLSAAQPSPESIPPPNPILSTWTRIVRPSSGKRCVGERETERQRGSGQRRALQDQSGQVNSCCLKASLPSCCCIFSAYLTRADPQTIRARSAVTQENHFSCSTVVDRISLPLLPHLTALPNHTLGTSTIYLYLPPAYSHHGTAISPASPPPLPPTHRFDSPCDFRFTLINQNDIVILHDDGNGLASAPLRRHGVRPHVRGATRCSSAVSRPVGGQRPAAASTAASTQLRDFAPALRYICTDVAANSYHEGSDETDADFYAIHFYSCFCAFARPEQLVCDGELSPDDAIQH